MREALILHCEDYAGLRRAIQSALAIRNPNYKVVAEAASVAEARKHFVALTKQAIALNVLLLDGQLEDGGADEVIAQMESLGIDLPVIGFAGSPLSIYGLHVGEQLIAEVPKGGGEAVDAIVSILQDLPEPRQTTS